MSYAEFGRWYDEYRRDVLDPAMNAAADALEATLEGALSNRDRTRIRRTSARVKSKRRTWRKLRRLAASADVVTVEHIPPMIHDLVGLRITCTNLRDIEMIQGALDILPSHGGSATPLALDPNSERDYVHEPKESGYRGWHVNLAVPISVDGKHELVTVELQVRTLLQDSWGELTHEDTYSKDGELPPLVEVLSSRMADLFATIDDIAEDLRSELDRLDQAAVGDLDSPAVTIDEAWVEQAGDAATMLRDRWSQLDVPVDLAALAWELQREFGAEVSNDWFGAGSFKRFVLSSIPEAEISTGRQAYLLPAVAVEAPADPVDEITAPTDVPAAAIAFRRVDPAFPVIETDQWQMVFQQLAAATRRLGPHDGRPGNLNRLTRSARDSARSTGIPVSRRHLDYVAKAVLADGWTAALDAETLASSFNEAMAQRMVDVRVLGERNKKRRNALATWLGSAPPSTDG